MPCERQKEQFIREGYIIVRGLIPPETVVTTRDRILEALGIDPALPDTWQDKSVPYQIAALTESCRTPAVEAVAQELVGPDFRRGVAYSPFLEAKGLEPELRGYIPVLNFPAPGPPEFVPPSHYHIDGMHRTTLWPDKHFLVVFAYLTDVAPHGGATALRPGSHRQVFTHWLTTGHPGSTDPPNLAYAEAVPASGKAGDVIFMHYLMVHSGSANRSDRIRVGLNTAILPDPEHPYRPKIGPPQPDWTPLDWTLRTDNLGAG